MTQASGHPFGDYPGGDSIKRLEDLSVHEKRVFVRVDFNVPMKNGTITDDSRIQAALPTIEFLRANGARLVLGSHLGRPKGPSAELSLEPIAARLGELLGTEVMFCHDSVGDAIVAEVRRLKAGEVLLLENLRFHAGEEKNDAKHIGLLKELCDVYVNDAFGTCHRAHASTAGLPDLMTEKAAGRLLEKEIQALGTLVHNPPRPLVAVLGGAKVSDKIKVIEALMVKASKILIGGAMANTFSAARGLVLGESRMEPDKVPLAKRLLEKSIEARCEIVLPIDYVVADAMDKPETAKAVLATDVPAHAKAFDIGPKSQALFTQALQGAQSIFWNGPVGVFEVAPFHKGTLSVAQAIAEHPAAVKICGGGDSVAAIHQLHAESGFSHISTGGGASLEMVEGVAMPGIESLKGYKK